jgi:hypothetical protein
MPSTPTTRFGFVTEADGDALVSAAGRLRTLAAAIDSAITGFLSGTAASRPGAAVAGRLYLATDVAGEIAMDTGSAWVSVSPGYGTSLPTTGLYDGQQFIYTADGTNGVRWHLRYNASGGTYKWECVGGPALVSEILYNTSTGESTTSASAVDLTTVGPSKNIPLAGDYDIEFGSHITLTSGMPGGGIVLLCLGAETSAPIERQINMSGFNNGEDGESSANRRVTISAASTVAKMRYASNQAGDSITFYNRVLRIKPVRVA